MFLLPFFWLGYPAFVRRGYLVLRSAIIHHILRLCHIIVPLSYHGLALLYSCHLRLSPTTTIQNTRPICPLRSATCRWFNIYFLFSPTTRPKRHPFLQMSLQERGYSDLGYVSPGTQNGSSI